MTKDPFALETPEDELADQLAQLPGRLVDALVSLRRDRHIDAKDVARRMHRHPSQVSRFENEDADPRLSTIIRYAYAVGANLSFEITGADVHGYTEVSRTAEDDDCGGKVLTFPVIVEQETRQEDLGVYAKAL